jgi:uncharacterized radical SAM superfamily Fe-S cluster-containing enzyme
LLLNAFKTLFPRQTVAFVYKLVKRESDEKDTGKHSLLVKDIIQTLYIESDNQVNSKIHFTAKFLSLKDGIYKKFYSD